MNRKKTKSYSVAKANLTACLTASLVTLQGLAGCAGSSKRPSIRNEAPRANLPVGPSFAEKTPTREASTELLQKSVARVLGFTDVGDIALTVFQDTESALYETLATQASTPSGTAPDPIFYYSPVFIAGSPKLMPLPSGELNVTMPNMYTQQAVRQVISDRMADVLAQYKIKVEKIGMLPMEGLKAEIKAFGKTYSDGVDMDAEFRTIVFKVPSADVPQTVIDALKNSKDKNEAGLEFLDALSMITIKYEYYVQQYGSQQCRMNVSTEDIRNMFADQEGCPPPPDQAKIAEGLKFVNDTRPSAAASVNSKLAALMQAGSTVTACLAAKEARKLQAGMSVSCTKGGTRSIDQEKNGTGTNYSPMVTEFLAKTIEPSLKSEIAKADAATWSDEVMAAVIRMFGNPQEYAQIVDSINNEIQNKDVTELDNKYYNKVANFFYTMRNHDVTDQANSKVDQSSGGSKSSQKAKGGGGGFNLNIPGNFGFGVGVGGSGSTANGNASEQFKRDYNEFHKLMRNINNSVDSGSNEAVTQTSQYLYNMGFDHGIEKVNGKFQIIPRINIAVRADTNKAEQYAQSMRTNDLGEIVREKENIPVQLQGPEPAELVVRIQCSPDPSPASWTGTKEYLTQFQWEQSAAFWNKLSDKVTAAVFQGGCSFLGVKMWYRNAERNMGMAPRVLDVTVHGVVVNTTTTTGADGQPKVSETFERSLPIAIEVRRENTEAKPAEGNIAIDAKAKRFTKIRISQ